MKEWLSSPLGISCIFVGRRYNILAAKAVASAKNEKIAAKILFDIVGLEAEKYRLGHTKASCKTQ